MNKYVITGKCQGIKSFWTGNGWTTEIGFSKHYERKSLALWDLTAEAAKISDAQNVKLEPLYLRR